VELVSTGVIMSAEERSARADICTNRIVLPLNAQTTAEPGVCAVARVGYLTGAPAR
jgi:hypothetical protein